MEAFANDKSNIYPNIKIDFHVVENIVEKGENADHQHFLLFSK